MPISANGKCSRSCPRDALRLALFGSRTTNERSAMAIHMGAHVTNAPIPEAHFARNRRPCHFLTLQTRAPSQAAACINTFTNTMVSLNSPSPHYPPHNPPIKEKISTTNIGNESCHLSSCLHTISATSNVLFIQCNPAHSWPLFLTPPACFDTPRRFFSTPVAY